MVFWQVVRTSELIILVVYRLLVAGIHTAVDTCCLQEVVTLYLYDACVSYLCSARR